MLWYCSVTMMPETFTFQSVYICSNQQVFDNVHWEITKPPSSSSYSRFNLHNIRPFVVDSINLIQNPYLTYMTEHIIPRVVLFLFSAHNLILNKNTVLTD